MSVVAIRGALETALAAMSPALATAYENAPFTPTAGTPYQAVAILFARPLNDEISAHYVEQGYMQVTLRYPQNAGTADVAARAEAIRSTFKRGNSFASGGVTVLITDTPEVATAYLDGDRYCVPVKCRFMAQVIAS